MTTNGPHIRPHCSPTLAGNRQPQVHVIDDDPDVSCMIQLRLKPHGVKVIRSFDSASGLLTSLETKPDVIVVDLKLPEHAGQRLIFQLRNSEETCRIPIIVLTGQSDQQLRHQVESLGSVSYLTKPLQISELLRELRRYIPKAGEATDARSLFIHAPHSFICLL